LDEDKIEYLTANQRQLRKQETDKVEDDMKEQVPFPLCQRVYKQYQLMGQSAIVLRDNSIDDMSELFPTPLAPQGVSKWEQFMGGTNIHQFTGDMTGKRQNFAPHINKDSTPYSVFMLYFAAVTTLLVEDTDAINNT
jgi:hypothetical protein